MLAIITSRAGSVGLSVCTKCFYHSRIFFCKSGQIIANVFIFSNRLFFFPILNIEQKLNRICSNNYIDRPTGNVYRPKAIKMCLMYRVSQKVIHYQISKKNHIKLY